MEAICNSLLDMLASEAVSSSSPSSYYLRILCYSGNTQKCVLLTSEIKLYGYFLWLVSVLHWRWSCVYVEIEIWS